jgi:hypothetical protein
MLLLSREELKLRELRRISAIARREMAGDNIMMEEDEIGRRLIEEMRGNRN